MFQLVNANVPFLDRRVLIQHIAEGDEAQGVHQICSELLSSLQANKKSIKHRTREGTTSWTLACEGGNYGGQHEDTKLSLPFLVNTRITECNSPVSWDYNKEIATFESGAQVGCSKDNKGYKLGKTVAQRKSEKRHKLSDELVEKKRKKGPLEDDLRSNGRKERDSYWERRKKNNASAKRSRDARKVREMQTQIKAAFLERENLRIQAQLMIVQQENACLKRVLCAKM